MSLKDLTSIPEVELLKNHGLDYLLKAHTCEVCSNAGNIICLGCYSSWYCSDEHLKSDAGAHKASCSSPLTVETSEAFGRYYVAARNLDAGMVILEETPAFGGPRSPKDQLDYVYCLGCCLKMNTDEGSGAQTGFRRCTKCRWPMCSPACEKNPIHSRECELFASNNVLFPPKLDLHSTYKGIFNIRGLFLKESDPKVWAEIEKLDDVAPKLGKIALFPNLEVYKHIYGIPQNFGSTDDWNKIQGICNINAFWEARDSRCGNFVFPKASLFAQSCAANSRWKVRFSTPTSPCPIMSVHTTVPIMKGEMVGINYTREEAVKGTYARRNMGFVCLCSRCVDKEELGTFTSGMKCPQTNCTGILLPSNPTGQSNKDSSWMCNVTRHRMPEESLMKIVALMETSLESLPLTSIEAYMVNKLDPALHPNHWILLQASSRIVLETDIGEVNKLEGKDLDRYIWHCRRILRVYDVLIPGLSEERGRILRAVGPPELRRLDGKFTLQNIPDTLCEALRLYNELKEAFLCLKDHPPTSPLPPDKYDLRAYSILLVMNNAKEMIDALKRFTQVQ